MATAGDDRWSGRPGVWRLEVIGQLVDASNASLLCQLNTPAHGAVRVIYKPRAGERPLWDFPEGTLSQREVAARVVSDSLGWTIVPPTVWRDGPFGPGMVQHWVDVDEGIDLVAFVQSDLGQLRRIAVFDALINNADRKGGHLLRRISMFGALITVSPSPSRTSCGPCCGSGRGQPLPDDLVGRSSNWLTLWGQGSEWADESGRLALARRVRRATRTRTAARTGQNAPAALARLACDPLAAVLIGAR